MFHRKVGICGFASILIEQKISYFRKFYREYKVIGIVCVAYMITCWMCNQYLHAVNKSYDYTSNMEFSTFKLSSFVIVVSITSIVLKVQVFVVGFANMNNIRRMGFHYLHKLNAENIPRDLIEKGQKRVIEASLTLIQERAKLKARVVSNIVLITLRNCCKVVCQLEFCFLTLIFSVK